MYENYLKYSQLSKLAGILISNFWSETKVFPTVDLFLKVGAMRKLFKLIENLQCDKFIQVKQYRFKYNRQNLPSLYQQLVSLFIAIVLCIANFFGVVRIEKIDVLLWLQMTSHKCKRIKRDDWFYFSNAFSPQDKRNKLDETMFDTTLILVFFQDCISFVVRYR